MAVEHIVLSLAGAVPRWWHPLHGNGEGELSTMPAQGRLALTVLVPGRDVTIARVALPVGGRQRLRQALPFAMEDQLVEDVDHYHFALGAKLEDGGWLAAAVALDTMHRWMDLLGEAGLSPDALIPAPLVLPKPAAADQANILLTEGHALVRVGSQQAFAADLSDLDVLLSLQPELKILKVADPEGSWPGPADLTREPLNFGQWPQDWALAPARAELNLLQGRWQGRGDAAATIAGLWRWAAAAVLAAGVLLLTHRYLEVRALSEQLRVLQGTAGQVAGSVLANVAPGSDYRTQLGAALARLQGARGAAEDGFLFLLELVGPALVAGDRIELSSINFRSDGMVLDLTAGSLDQVESLRRRRPGAGPGGDRVQRDGGRWHPGADADRGGAARMNTRERRLVWLAGIMVAVFVVWLAAWRPLTRQRETLSSSVTRISDDLPWMRAAAAEIQRLGDSSEPVSRGGQSLLALAESSARGAGLGQSWRRAEPGAGGELRVWLENAQFDAMLRWLMLLQQRYSVSVAEASIDQAGVPGVVNVRLLLAEPLADSLAE